MNDEDSERRTQMQSMKLEAADDIGKNKINEDDGETIIGRKVAEGCPERNWRMSGCPDVRKGIWRSERSMRDASEMQMMFLRNVSEVTEWRP